MFDHDCCICDQIRSDQISRTRSNPTRFPNRKPIHPRRTPSLIYLPNPRSKPRPPKRERGPFPLSAELPPRLPCVAQIPSGFRSPTSNSRGAPGAAAMGSLSPPRNASQRGQQPWTGQQAEIRGHGTQQQGRSGSGDAGRPQGQGGGGGGLMSFIFGGGQQQPRQPPQTVKLPQVAE